MAPPGPDSLLARFGVEARSVDEPRVLSIPEVGRLLELLEMPRRFT